MMIALFAATRFCCMYGDDNACAAVEFLVVQRVKQGGSVL